MDDPIEQLAAALVLHRDNHPDEDDRPVRIWIDTPGVSDDQLYHRFSLRQIAKLAEYIAASQPSASFPGVPGDRWRDSDGDVWVLCDDGRMRQTHKNTAPEDVERVYGPMTRMGGA